MIEAMRLSARSLALGLLLISVACEAIGLEQVSLEQRANMSRRSVLDDDDVSLVTRSILRRRGITGYRHDPVGALSQLNLEMHETRDRSLAPAIAELAYLQTRRVSAFDRRALTTAVRYSYAYLFDPKLVPEPQVFDARFRFACDMYNTALADLVRHYQGELKDAKHEWRVEWHAGETTASIGINELDWALSEFDSLRVASDLLVSGLEPPAMRRGIGVPCLVSRTWGRKAAKKSEVVTRFSFLPQDIAFPATMLMRWPASASVLDDEHAPAEFDIYDPMETVTATIGKYTVPLEVDYTTPMAATVRKRDTPSGLSALLHVNEYESQTGLYMFQPYKPDRIFVLFVHGLASGPETWIPLYNQLLADETIRTRFQFAFWFYPTGQPALNSAADLRKALNEAHEHLGDVSRLRSTSDAVIIAHSLGGILGNTLVVDSGDTLWTAMFTAPASELPVTEKQRAQLKDMYFFEHEPFVKRVIYFSCPHRGAPEASTGFMQWASGLIHLPADLLGPQHAIRPYIRKDMRYKHYTVAQSLAAHNPVMVALTDIKPAPGVTVHSIIGDRDKAGKKGGSDGLVPYWSSHIDFAESELIIRSGHSTEHKPRGAREAHRILLEHLAAYDQASRK